MYANNQGIVRRTASASGLGCGSPSCYNGESLGALPALIPTAIQVGGAIIGGITGSGDSTRFAAVDRRKQLALGGDRGSLLVLKCWAGIPTPELNQYPALAADVGINAEGTNCGFATSAAKAYARAAYEEVLVRMKIGPTLTGAGISTYPGQLTPLFQAGAGAGATVLLLGGAVLLLAMRGGKRRRRR